MWKTGTIAELCEIEYGTRVVRKNESGDEFPVYGGGGETFRINRKNRTNRLVVSRFGMSENCTRFVDGDFFLNDSGLTVSPKVSDLSQAYLDKVILAKNNEIYSLGRGSAQKNLNMNGFKALSFHYPSMAEQQSIVEKLDKLLAKIDAAVAFVEKKQTHSSVLLNQFLSTINADAVKLDDIVQIKTGRLDANAMVEGGEYPFFTCSKQIYEIDKYAFDCDAVLLAGNNASGDFNVKHYIGKFNAYQRTYVLTVKNTSMLRSRYLYFQLIQALSKFKTMSVGTNTKFLKLGMIKNFEIPLPSIGQQDAILEKLQTLEHSNRLLDNNHSLALSNYSALKSAILAQELQSEAA